jgi:hypothetical protein
MDLVQVGTKAILIPTPGQPEQEYLGERLQGHPQFVVQRQGKVNLKAGIEVLMQRPEIQPYGSNQLLLNSTIVRFCESLHTSVL